MSQRGLRRREPLIGVGKTKPPHPSPSPRRKTPRSLNCKSKDGMILKSNSSAPALLPDNLDRAGDDGQEFMREEMFLCPRTFSEASLSSPSLSAFSQRHTYQRYNREAKVVVNVTVEGSPGPVRAMVKLGSSVEDTIKLVVDKYNEEGRTPKLDPDAASSFQLHHSSFSLQSLGKSEKIGDVGGRTFFLRTSRRASDSYSGTVGDSATQNSAAPIPPSPFLLRSWIVQEIRKFVRRVCKLWKFVVCF